MSAVDIQYRTPGWQTEELQEEWVELDEDKSDNDDHDLTCGTRSVSLTAPLSSQIHTSNNAGQDEYSQGQTSLAAVGTFLVREDIRNAPLLPKTPGWNKKGNMKDFFSPMPLEKLFEPPSPPKAATTTASNDDISNQPPTSRNEEIPSKAKDKIAETDVPGMRNFHGSKASAACQFTFSAPRERSLNPNPGGTFPQAQSTPNPPLLTNEIVPPATDPRLRLFQFQYDTYTREHLSAMVDSIAINSGSGTTPSPTSFIHGLSRVSEQTGSVEHLSHLRSAKRVKLSPKADFYGEGDGEGATISRPRTIGRDYVGESRNLMQRIRQARDFSTVSTVVSNRQTSPPVDSDVTGKEHSSEPSPQLLNVPKRNTDSSGGGSYSSSSYRLQAEALMAQIKSDMKGQKRLFSGDTEASYFTAHVGDKHDSDISQALQPSREDSRRKLSHHRTSSGKSIKSNASKHKPSPRKSRAPNAGAETIVEQVSRLSLQDRRSFSDGSIHSSHPSSNKKTQTQRIVSLSSAPSSNALSTHAPPSYPSSSLRHDDLNRFVSSSTASGTTLTAGSAPSFVKHAGPAHIRTIAPADLPEIPDRLGNMLYDKVMMKWVRSTAAALHDAHGDPQTEELSEDPFQDIESLKDDSRSKDAAYETSDRQPHQTEMSRIEERSEMDEEEVDLTSFSTDDPSALVVDVMTGVETFEDMDSSDSDDDGAEHVTVTGIIDYDSDDMQQSSYVASPAVEARPLSPPLQVELVSTPKRAQPSRSTATPIIRSALKSRTNTPTSAMKEGSRVKLQTPLPKRHRRSVSFSDGKKEGPIQGLSESTTDDGEDAHSSGTDLLVSVGGNAASMSGFVQSARSKRIAQLVDALEGNDESPTKSSSFGHTSTQALSSWGGNAGNPADASRGKLSRSRMGRHSFNAGNVNANATFLTECSFGVAHDRLVEVITDIEPFMPYWEELSSVDLSEKKLESVARLKEFLPRLDVLVLNSNQLAWLSGVPGSVRTLSVSSNSLTSLTSFNHLLNLENLDISRNDIESLTQLACLRHLRELKADGNKITSTEGLQRMDGLVKLSLQGNSIRCIDCSQYRWTRLEMLNVSQNRLDSVLGLGSLQGLVALNLDNNELGELEFDGTMSKLRILRVSGNRLHQVGVTSLPNLRTLYADNNSLSTLVKVDRLTKLENLSVRNQSGRGLNLLTRDVRDVKRLYLSGNPLKSGFLSEPCYNLVYLEVAACRLTALPEDFARLVPNLRVLNLNYNFLEDVKGLEGLTRLKKLSVIGSRLKGTKAVIRLLQVMPEVEMLDFRMNPCTLGWYLPLLVKDIPGALQPSEVGGVGSRGRWEELDSKFRRDLPDSLYIGRLAYRGLIMRACKEIRLLDGVEVSAKERAKADELLAGIVGQA